MNPWCTIGGVATSVCQTSELIMLVFNIIPIFNPSFLKIKLNIKAR